MHAWEALQVCLSSFFCLLSSPALIGSTVLSSPILRGEERGRHTPMNRRAAHSAYRGGRGHSSTSSLTEAERLYSRSEEAAVVLLACMPFLLIFDRLALWYVTCYFPSSYTYGEEREAITIDCLYSLPSTKPSHGAGLGDFL